MNRWEIENLQRRFGDEQPNARRGATVLNHLMIWTDRNSDGWPYWSKPSKAAERLMIELDRVKNHGFADEVDLTDAELAGALRPIKAFLTRQKVPAETREWIVDPEASAKRSADIAAAAAASRTEALHEEARAYARGIVNGVVGNLPVLDAIADAYFAGATR